MLISKVQFKKFPTPLIQIGEWIRDNFDLFSQIQKKLDKRKESMDDLNNLKLANFVDGKAESIRNKPNLVFRFLKDVLDELSRYVNPQWKLSGMFFVVTRYGYEGYLTQNQYSSIRVFSAFCEYSSPLFFRKSSTCS